MRTTTKQKLFYIIIILSHLFLAYKNFSFQGLMSKRSGEVIDYVYKRQNIYKPLYLKEYNEFVSHHFPDIKRLLNKAHFVEVPYNLMTSVCNVGPFSENIMVWGCHKPEMSWVLFISSIETHQCETELHEIVHMALHYSNYNKFKNAAHQHKLFDRIDAICKDIKEDYKENK